MISRILLDGVKAISPYIWSFLGDFWPVGQSRASPCPWLQGGRQPGAWDLRPPKARSTELNTWHLTIFNHAQTCYQNCLKKIAAERKWACRPTPTSKQPYPTTHHGCTPYHCPDCWIPAMLGRKAHSTPAATIYQAAVVLCRRIPNYINFTDSVLWWNTFWTVSPMNASLKRHW